MSLFRPSTTAPFRRDRAGDGRCYCTRSDALPSQAATRSDVAVICAFGPEANIDPRGVQAAPQRAAERLAAWETRAGCPAPKPQSPFSSPQRKLGSRLRPGPNVPGAWIPACGRNDGSPLFAPASARAQTPHWHAGRASSTCGVLGFRRGRAPASPRPAGVGRHKPSI